MGHPRPERAADMAALLCGVGVDEQSICRECALDALFVAYDKFPPYEFTKQLAAELKRRLAQGRCAHQEEKQAKG